MSKSYEMNGKIKLIDKKQTFDSGFEKREFVATDEDDKYPQDVKFELIKDKCDLISTFQEGEHVKVSFNIKGNEYNGRHFVNLQAWKVEYQEGKETMEEAQVQAEIAQEEAKQDDPNNSLPF